MTQPTNPIAINNIATDFQKRAEAQFQLGLTHDLIRSIQGLRGFWSMASISSVGQVADGSGNNLPLSRNAVIFSNWGIAPVALYTGVADYLYRTDNAVIETLGTEVWFSDKGMTAGGWFQVTAPANGMTLMSKQNLVGNYCWKLYLNAALQPTFSVSGDGTNEVSVSHSTAITTDKWHFIWGMFYPSTQISVGLDSVVVSNAVGIPASLFNSTGYFEIGGWTGTNGLLVGKSSLNFLAATRANEALLWSIYHYSKDIFG